LPPGFDPPRDVFKKEDNAVLQGEQAAQLGIQPRADVCTA